MDYVCWEWLGLTGLKDPIRPEVPQAVRQCQEAGIRVVMITGEHALTAQAIAKQAGIPAAFAYPVFRNDYQPYLRHCF